MIKMLVAITALLVLASVAMAHQIFVPRIAGSGDLNGDGLSDLIIASPYVSPQAVFNEPSGNSDLNREVYSYFLQQPTTMNNLTYDSARYVFIGNTVLVIPRSSRREFIIEDINGDNRNDLVYSDTNCQKWGYLNLGQDSKADYLRFSALSAVSDTAYVPPINRPTRDVDE